MCGRVGLGTVRGVGVMPEAHRVSWFASVRGRKRWVLTPPTDRFPSAALERRPGGACAVDARAISPRALRCDVPLGGVLWVPEWYVRTDAGHPSVTICHDGLH